MLKDPLNEPIVYVWLGRNKDYDAEGKVCADCSRSCLADKASVSKKEEGIAKQCKDYAHTHALSYFENSQTKFNYVALKRQKRCQKSLKL